MDKTYYGSLDQTLYTEVLPNGLRVFVDHRPGFSQKICYLAVDFGAVHTHFTFDGAHYEMPAGIAHYLEHKMFDMPGRDVTAELGALGVRVNAFTSYDMTAYHISATENFEQGLKLLLEFVSTPYFTAETVEKERSIIAQEIGMSADEPAGRCFEDLMTVVYEAHPIRVPILGTEKSIAAITPEMLSLCHRAFYTPQNMVLCVVGDVAPQTVCHTARQVLGDAQRPMGIKDTFPQERPQCRTAYRERCMEVAMPMFCMAFKTTCPEKGEEAIRREMIGELAAEALFGESSPLYMRLYEQGLIDTSFGGGFDTVDGCAMLSCSGDSHDPRAVQQAILAQAQKLSREGIGHAEFLRLKRSAMGGRIRDLDSFGATCFRICAYEMSGFDYFRFPELMQSIRWEQVQQFLSEVVRAEACGLSVIYPMKEEHS